MGQYFGRAVEKAVAEMIQTNTRITKLGFNCEDAHWRDVIGRAIIKNNDLARRRRKGGADKPAEVEVVAKEKAMNKIRMTAPPGDKAAWEIFEDDDEKLNLARGFIAE